MTSIFDIDLPRNAANHTPLSPLSFLERAAEVYPQRTAIVHGALRRTWLQTYERCRRLASALVGLVLARRDRDALERLLQALQAAQLDGIERVLDARLAAHIERVLAAPAATSTTGLTPA